MINKIETMESQINEQFNVYVKSIDRINEIINEGSGDKNRQELIDSFIAIKESLTAVFPVMDFILRYHHVAQTITSSAGRDIEEIQKGLMSLGIIIN